MPRPTFYALRSGSGWYVEPNDTAPWSTRSVRVAEIVARTLGSAWEVAPLPVVVGEPVEVGEYERAIRVAVRGEGE